MLTAEAADAAAAGGNPHRHGGRVDVLPGGLEAGLAGGAGSTCQVQQVLRGSQGPAVYLAAAHTMHPPGTAGNSLGLGRPYR